MPRDAVRLLVAHPEGVEHHRFRDLPRFLAPGDLVVVNTSATLPAALDGRREDGREVVVHVATELDPVGGVVVELRRLDGDGPVTDGQPGEWISLPYGAGLQLVAPRDARRSSESGPRLWLAQAFVEDGIVPFLNAHGRPITYGYVNEAWPLDMYQTVFARRPGSAEMPSAGRPVSPELVVELVTRGVTLAPILLHTGVSSLEHGERPQPERYVVPPSTAALVNHTRARGGRIVAVGTTATRALESAVDHDGRLTARHGWTDLVLGPTRPARVVSGLITGWHDAGSSHLDLLHAVVGADLVKAAYWAATASGYRWHEFGDACLYLPRSRETQGAKASRTSWRPARHTP